MNAPNRARLKCASPNWPDRPADCPAVPPAVTAPLHPHRAPLKMPALLAGIFHSQSYGADGMVHGASDMVYVQPPRESEYVGHCGGGCPRARADRAFAGRQAGSPRQYWAVRQDGRKRPFHAGFRACLPAIPNPREPQANHDTTARCCVPRRASLRAGSRGASPKRPNLPDDCSASAARPAVPTAQCPATPLSRYPAAFPCWGCSIRIARESGFRANLV